MLQKGPNKSSNGNLKTRKCRSDFFDSSVRKVLKRGGKNFKKFDKNKDQNKKLFHQKSVRFFAQN